MHKTILNTRDGKRYSLTFYMFVFIFAINDELLFQLFVSLLFCSLQVTFTRQLSSIFLNVNHILGLCCGQLRGNNAKKNNIIYIFNYFILLSFFGFRFSFFLCATFCVPSATSAVELLRSPLPVACPFTVDNTHSHTSTHNTSTHTRTPREVLRYCSGIVLLASFAKDSLLLLLTVLLMLWLLLLLQLCNVSGAAPAHVPHSIPCGECAACERQSLQSPRRGSFCFLLHFATPKKYATVFCPCY